MEVDKGAKLKATEANEYECCLSCLELQDKITEANEKLVHLELEIAKQNSVIEALNQRNKELLQEGIQNRKDEEEDGNCTVIENEALKCQKNKAEREIEFWKANCSELEKVLIDLKKKSSSVNVITKTSSFSSPENKTKSNQDKDPSGTSPINTLYNQCTNSEIFKKGRRRKLKNILRRHQGGLGPLLAPTKLVIAMTTLQYR